MAGAEPALGVKSSPTAEHSAEEIARGDLADALHALGLTVPDAGQQQLLAYLALLQRWNKVYNLSAIRAPADMLVQHLVDCLAIVPALDRHLECADPAHGPSLDKDPRAPAGDASCPASPGAASDEPVRVPHILDVGSGGGLPGVVLAIVRPHWRVDCVDTVSKKASFIRQVAAELGLTHLRGLHARVESLPGPTHPPVDAGAAPADQGVAVATSVALPAGAGAGYDVITSRAFASLADFTHLSQHLLRPNGVWVAMKARSTEGEQAALNPSVDVFHVERLDVPGLDAERHLVWMRPHA